MIEELNRLTLAYLNYTCCDSSANHPNVGRVIRDAPIYVIGIYSLSKFPLSENYICLRASSHHKSHLIFK